MKIKYITEDELMMIKSNTAAIFKEVVQNKDKTLEEFFGDEHFIKDSSYEIKEFTLDISQLKGKETLTDQENIQRVYNHMKFLSDSQASDERIWTAYTFSVSIDYMRYRWMPTNVNNMENRYLFNYSNQRSLFRNGISRLWWIGRVSYDSSRDDPYELTKFLCKDQDFIESICGRNVFNNPDIGLTTVKALYDAYKNGINVDRYIVRKIARYMNLLAGTYILDAVETNEIYNKVRKKLNF